MNVGKITGVSFAGGGLLLAGLSITSDQVKGWLDVVGQLVTHPHAAVLFVALVGILLAWLFIRCQTAEAELHKRFDRLQRAVFLALQSDEPDVIRKILIEWEGIIDGSARLDDVIAMPDRRKPARRRTT